METTPLSLLGRIFQKEVIVRTQEQEREHSRKWRERNPEKEKSKTRDKEKKNRQAWMELIIIPSGRNKCIKCGYDKCFGAIEFHHRNPEEKKFEIGYMLKNRITEERIRELEKTDSLCANCHREFHRLNQ
jgi:hypothetical protein